MRGLEGYLLLEGMGGGAVGLAGGDVRVEVKASGEDERRGEREVW